MITITQVKTHTTVDLCWDSTMLRGKKRKENRDRDIQTQTERYEDYKCLRSSVNLHNQRQACPVNINRLCVHLCQPVFTSVGTKTTSNLQERDTERERKRTEKGEDRSRGQQGSSGWVELSKRWRKRNRESEGWRGREERVNQWRRFETGRLWRQYRLEIRASVPYTNTLVLPGRTATHTLSHCQLTRHAQGLSAGAFHHRSCTAIGTLCSLVLPDFPFWNDYPCDG